MEIGTQLIKLAGSLALVLAAFFVFVYGFKRWGPKIRRPSAQTLLEVMSKQSFGPRHHLLLVKVAGGTNVLIGISPQHMNLLTITGPETSGNAATIVAENL